MHFDERVLKGLYGKGYFFGEEYSDYLADRDAIQKNFNQRLKVLHSHIDDYRHKHLLEIGCAYGFFLDIARNSFETVRGIDITKEGITYASEYLKVDAICADFLQHDFGAQRFDVVCMWDTIEHLQNPHLYIEKIAELTEPGALITITTGDIESFNARIGKSRWRLIHPPTHLHYFSKKTLERTLQRYGFDVVYNRYCGFYRSIDMAAYRIFMLKKKWREAYRLVRESWLGRVYFYLNLFDIMYVIARKR
jgi:2-polyprenyl-3-methyl-5-hydroxy-6-metoxy-1,4-benzoquinol methylase